MQVVITIIFWTICGFSTAYFAKDKGKDPVKWFFIGLLLGVFGLMLVFIMSKIEEKQQAEQKKENSKNQLKLMQSEDKHLKWFYITAERKQVGPITWDSLSDKWKDQIINPKTFIWREGWKEWKRIEDLNFTQNQFN